MSRSVQALAYARPSALTTEAGTGLLGLETSGGLTPVGRQTHPQFCVERCGATGPLPQGLAPAAARTGSSQLATQARRLRTALHPSPHPTAAAAGQPRRQTRPAPVDPDDAHRRTWTLRIPALLAVDDPERQARPGERRLTAQTAVEEAEFACRTAEGLAAREAFGPGQPYTPAPQAGDRRAGPV